MNKKGFFGDLIFIGVLLLAVALCGTLVFYVLDLIQEKMETVSIINGTSFGHSALEGMGIVAGKMDYIFVAFLVASIVGFLIVSWLIPLNFIFAGIYFIVMVLAVVLSAILSNVWEMVTTTGSLAGVVSQVPVTNYVLGHLPIFLGVLGFLGFIAMFAKGAVSQ